MTRSARACRLASTRAPARARRGPEQDALVRDRGAVITACPSACRPTSGARESCVGLLWTMDIGEGLVGEVEAHAVADSLKQRDVCPCPAASYQHGSCEDSARARRTRSGSCARPSRRWTKRRRTGSVGGIEPCAASRPLIVDVSAVVRGGLLSMVSPPYAAMRQWGDLELRRPRWRNEFTRPGLVCDYTSPRQAGCRGRRPAAGTGPRGASSAAQPCHGAARGVRRRGSPPAETPRHATRCPPRRGARSASSNTRLLVSERGRPKHFAIPTREALQLVEHAADGGVRGGGSRGGRARVPAWARTTPCASALLSPQPPAPVDVGLSSAATATCSRARAAKNRRRKMLGLFSLGGGGGGPIHASNEVNAISVNVSDTIVATHTTSPILLKTMMVQPSRKTELNVVVTAAEMMAEPDSSSASRTRSALLGRPRVEAVRAAARARGGGDRGRASMVGLRHVQHEVDAVSDENDDRNGLDRAKAPLHHAAHESKEHEDDGQDRNRREHGEAGRTREEAQRQERGAEGDHARLERRAQYEHEHQRGDPQVADLEHGADAGRSVEIVNVRVPFLVMLEDLRRRERRWDVRNEAHHKPSNRARRAVPTDDFIVIAAAFVQERFDQVCEVCFVTDRQPGDVGIRCLDHRGATR